ncbi:MAG: hypothetical protein ACRDTZ_16930, partial [Pseudonocardiaceae bacterium]
MALVVVRDPLTGTGFSAVPGLKCYLYTEDGSDSFSFEFAPKAITYSNWESEWVSVPRVGLAPLNMRKGGKLEEISFSANLADRDYFRDQEGHLNALRRIASSQKRVMMRYSGMEAGIWRIQKCGAASIERHPDTNAVIQATVDLTLTRAVDPVPGVGPVSTPATVATAAPAPAARAPRTRPVRAGDTLWSIAA